MDDYTKTCLWFSKQPILSFLFCFWIPISFFGQIHYLNDPGTSTLFFEEKGNLKFSSYIFDQNDQNFQIGYSLSNHIFLTGSRFSNQTFFYNRDKTTKRVASKSQSNSLAIGYFFTIHKKKGKVIIFSKQNTQWIIFDSYLGVTQGVHENEYFLSGLESRFNTLKYTGGFGILYQTKLGGIRLGFKYSEITFRKIKLTGSSNEYFDNLLDFYQEKNSFSGLELDLQVQFGIPMAKIRAGMPFIPLGSFNQIRFSSFESANVGLVIELDDFYKIIKRKR